MDFKKVKIKDLNKKLLSGDITPLDLLNHSIKMYEETKELNIFNNIFESAKEDAKRAKELIDSNKATILTGIPIAIKSNFNKKGEVIDCCSKILEGHTCVYDSSVVEILKRQGAIIIGSTNMDEFAMGSSTEHSIYGVTKNPFSKDRVAGGSSGGSAAAVSAGVVPLSIGSDTGGSVRQPASFCGVVGLKPTYGAISRYGLIALASSLDVVGVFANTIEDAEILFNELNKNCDKDSTKDIEIKSKKEMQKIIGIPKDLKDMNISSDVQEAFNKAIDKFKEKGYQVKEVDIKTFHDASSVYYIIQPAEASSNLSRYDGIRYGKAEEDENLWKEYLKTRNNFGVEVMSRIVLGTYVLTPENCDKYYGKALKVRDIMREEFKSSLKDVDIIMTPTTPSVAFKIGENSNPIDMYNQDRFTLQANIVGVPAISIPFKNKDLPIGIQLVGDFSSEDIIFEYGKVLEE